MKIRIFITTLFLISSIANSASLPTKNLIVNGDFSKVFNNRIEGWQRQKKAKIEIVNGKPTLVLNGGYASMTQDIKLNPAWKVLHLSMRMKGTEIKLGDANWKDGRLAMSFKDANGKRVGNWLKVFNVKGTSDWLQCERNYEVPFGAVSINITPANFGASGKLEFQDIKLTVKEIKKGGSVSMPIIILKLDDVTYLSKKWQACADFLRDEKVKASFGIIGSGLEKDNPKFFKWIKDLHKSGEIEFWNHGYKNRTSKDKYGEFESNSMEDQQKALQKTQDLAKNKLGISLTAFGPHWSSTNSKTVEALERISEIKSVFYYTDGSNDKRYVFKRYLDMEKPIFKPNFAFVKKSFESNMHNKPYLCLQGHANAWTPDAFENFKKIVRYFKAKGCKFMTASEYLEYKKSE